MPKTRIGERLSKVANESTSEKSRSNELATLNDKYEEFVKTFKPLLTALKNHHAELKKMEKTEAQVSEELAKWIKGTPVAVANVRHVQQSIQQRDATYAEKYLSDVVEYVHDWEMVVKTRVAATQKQVKESKAHLDHYEKKMESLTKTHDTVVAKGVTPNDKEVEKLKRNEEKLALAKNSYESQATQLCDMLEAVVDQAWRDLLPLLLKMLKLEHDKLEGQKVMLESSSVIENLKNIAEGYKIDITPPPPGPADITGSKKQVAPVKEESL